MSKDSSLTQLAHDRLRADLLACRLKPGERLVINQLCQKLNVSLGAVRDGSFDVSLPEVAFPATVRAPVPA